MGKRSLGLNSSARLTRIKKAVYRRNDIAGGGGGGGGGAGVVGLFLLILEKLGWSTKGTGKGKGKGKDKWKGKEKEEEPQQDYTEHHQQPQQHDSTFSKSQQRQGIIPTLAIPTSGNHTPQPGPSTSTNTYPMQKTSEEWRAIISPEQSRVLRK